MLKILIILDFRMSNFFFYRGLYGSFLQKNNSIIHAVSEKKMFEIYANQKAMLSFQMKLDYQGNIYTKFDSHLTPVIILEQYIPDTPAYVS